MSPGGSDRPRVRPWLRRVAIVSFALLVPLAAHSVWDHIEIRRMIREIESISDRKEPVTRGDAGERSEPFVGDGPGAGSYYAAAAHMAIDGPPGEAIPGVGFWLATGALRDSKDALRARLRRTTTRWADALALADHAEALPFEGFPAGHMEVNYFQSGLASVSYLLSSRIVALSLEGQADAAVDAALAALRYRPAVRRGLLWYTLGDPEVAAILSFSRPSPAALLRLQDALAAADKSDPPVDHLLRERARFIERVFQRYYGTDPHAPRAYHLPMRSVIESVLRPWFTHGFVTTLRVWDQVIAAARRPWPELIQAKAEIDRDYPETETRFRTGLLSWMNDVNPDLVPVSYFRLATRPEGVVADRSALVAVAVERFRRDHGGVPPEAVSTLIPEYLDAVVVDPMSGESLLYKVNPDGYTIYSVGENGRDDGGDLGRVPPPGGYQPSTRGADLGIRVLDLQ